jgi:alkylhydroperoxidase family enzyme
MPKAPNIMKIFSLRPEYLQAASSQFHTMWGGELPRTLKEMVAVTVSKATNCHY